MKTFWVKLLELLRESVITQSMLVFLIFGPIAYCVIAQLPIPDVLSNWAFIIIGFFFGSKSVYQVIKGLGK